MGTHAAPPFVQQHTYRMYDDAQRHQDLQKHIPRQLSAHIALAVLNGRSVLL